MQWSSEGECVGTIQSVLAETGGAWTDNRVIPWNGRTFVTATTAGASVRRLLSGEGEAEVKVERNRAFEQSSSPGSSFGRQLLFQIFLSLLKFVPNNQETVPLPFESQLSTFREWTCVRSSVGMRSQSCCAAFLASSPGHPFKVFHLIRANLQYLTLTEACWQRQCYQVYPFYCLTASHLTVKQVSHSIFDG